MEKIEIENQNFLLLKNLIKSHIKNYPKLKNYKKIVYSTSFFIIEKIEEKFKNDIICNIKELSTTKSQDKPREFILDKKNFFIISISMLNTYGNTVPLTLIFLKDFKNIKKIINYDCNFNIKDVFEFKCDGNGSYQINKIGFDVNIKQETPILNNNIEKEICNDITNFFKNKDFYKKNNFPYKRGVLLYGPPGNGKTLLIKHILSKSSNIYKLIIDISTNFQRDMLTEINSTFYGKKIIIMEDIDSLNEWSRSAFLNFLDGIENVEDTYFIATTNNIEKVDKALIKRPSRFDNIYYIGLPEKKSREKLLLRFFPSLKNKENLAKYVDLTDGFIGAYFKELYILTQTKKCSIDKTINYIRRQLELFASKGEQNYLG